ncbi:hypothetical protein [Streptomyces vietnamensis]|uniref:hypothetical protein n=1 Tax=Streptomyces vietnamensis TaxID=362257 RepID=UPI003425F9DE
MIKEFGKDGHLLVTTAMAAYSLGMKPDSFRSWARRHGMTATDYRRAAESTGRQPPSGLSPTCEDLPRIIGSMAQVVRHGGQPSGWPFAFVS